MHTAEGGLTRTTPLKLCYRMAAVAALATLLLCSATDKAFADFEDVAEDLIGYTIIAAKTIEGWRDSNGKKDDTFEGCEHGRIIIFSDGTTLTCGQYRYKYAYRPKAIILGKQVEYAGRSVVIYKMVVKGDVYDMRR